MTWYAQWYDDWHDYWGNYTWKALHGSHRAPGRLRGGNRTAEDHGSRSH